MMNIQIIGMKKALAKLYGIDMGLMDLTKPLKDTKKYLEGMMKKRFENRGDAPHKWAPISQETLRKREVNHSDQPLIDRGNLLRSVSSPRSRYANHTVFKNRLRFAISSTLRNNGVFYPAIMENGSRARNIPARPFMFLTEKNNKEINDIFHKYMEWLVNKPV